MVVVGRTAAPRAAPSELERVKERLNGWVVPDDTRSPDDRFEAYARRAKCERRCGGLAG